MTFHISIYENLPGCSMKSLSKCSTERVKFKAHLHKHRPKIMRIKIGFLCLFHHVWVDLTMVLSCCKILKNMNLYDLPIYSISIKCIHVPKMIQINWGCCVDPSQVCLAIFALHSHIYTEKIFSCRNKHHKVISSCKHRQTHM